MKNGKFVVFVSSETRYVRHVIRHPGDRTEFVLRNLVDLFHVDDVLEQARVLHRSQRQRRETVVVPDTQQFFEQVRLRRTFFQKNSNSVLDNAISVRDLN